MLQALCPAQDNASCIQNWDVLDRTIKTGRFVLANVRCLVNSNYLWFWFYNTKGLLENVIIKFREYYGILLQKLR